MIIALVDMVIAHKKHPQRSVGLSISALTFSAYQLSIYAAELYNGHWIFGKLDDLKLHELLTLCAVFTALGMSFYLLGEYLNKTLCRFSKKINKIN